MGEIRLSDVGECIQDALNRRNMIFYSEYGTLNVDIDDDGYSIKEVLPINGYYDYMPTLMFNEAPEIEGIIPNLYVYISFVNEEDENKKLDGNEEVYIDEAKFYTSIDSQEIYPEEFIMENIISDCKMGDILDCNEFIEADDKFELFNEDGKIDMQWGNINFLMDALLNILSGYDKYEDTRLNIHYKGESLEDLFELAKTITKVLINGEVIFEK